MGFSSQAGQVILRTQDVPGTYNADTGTDGVGIPLRSGALASSRELMIPDPEIGGGRDIADAFMGPGSWSGDYEFYLRMNSFATLLAACLGTPPAADTTVTGVNKYTYTPSDGATLPLLSIEERIGAGLECFHYNDAVVNTLHLEADPNGYAMGTASLIAAKQVAGAAFTADPVWDASPMIVGTAITLTYNSVSFAAKSFSLDINNNFEDDDFRLGSLYLGDLTPKRREITAGFTVREADSARWRSATYASPSATEMQGGVASKAPLVIDIKSYQVIPTTAVVYELKITIPEFAIEPYSFAVSGDDIIDDDITGQALRPDPAVAIMTAELSTDITDIA